jgi:hypothetical protein
MKDITSETIQQILDRFDSLPTTAAWTMHPTVAADPRAIRWLMTNGCLPRTVLEKK